MTPRRIAAASESNRHGVGDGTRTGAPATTDVTAAALAAAVTDVRLAAWCSAPSADPATLGILVRMSGPGIGPARVILFLCPCWEISSDAFNSDYPSVRFLLSSTDYCDLAIEARLL